MIDLYKLNQAHSEDLDSVNDWCEDTYQAHFANHFKGVHSLFDRMQSKDRPITNDELEWVLCSLPLELFTVSERLNQFRMNEEVLKLKIKKRQSEIKHELQSDGVSAALSAEAAKDAVSDDTLLLNAYSVVTSRVENEISFSRELIMGAKKIWDGRTKSENTMPVQPVNPADSLPVYEPEGQTYIKGGI